ncbi:MAG TPA: enolase C-terminal domain-like protein [Haliangium sp.]|nr:enolase C-terminal domain-like protein [Haliangium sp.]
MTGLRITAVELSRHGGAVSRVATARGEWSARQGLLVQLCDDQGHRGLGEASPLPGYSPDDLDDCEAELRALDSAALTVEPRGGDDDGTGLLVRLAAVTGRVRAPAARFALETALLDVIAQRTGAPLWRVLRAGAGLGPDPRHADAPAAVPLNAVCAQGDPGRVLDDVAAAHARGIRCFKLKVGRDVPSELAALEAARARHGDEISLRADANQAWQPAQAREHLQRLAALAPEYVEEPVVAPMAHLAALAPLPVPVALDESLAFTDTRTTPAADARVPELDALLAAGLASVLVLKPMLLGGALPAMALARRARAHGADVVISHIFDGPVALAACAHLAVALAASRACGLDRHNGLQAWPEIDIPFLGQARVDVPHQPGLGVSAPIEDRS